MCLVTALVRLGPTRHGFISRDHKFITVLVTHLTSVFTLLLVVLIEDTDGGTLVGRLDVPSHCSPPSSAWPAASAHPRQATA